MAYALVIDDSRTMRALLGRQLMSLGWNMPVMDGLTFVQQVRARPEWRGLTLMMVTTEAEHDQIVRALAAGAHDYLIKPFLPEAFVEKLNFLGLVPRPVDA
jgi:two-component system chemotaxis response regulator CheY